MACDSVFVLMGDASKIPVAGYGTSSIQIDGNVITWNDGISFEFCNIVVYRSLTVFDDGFNDWSRPLCA